MEWRWGGQVAPVVEGEPVRQQLAATYFDTADLRLAAAGLTIRRRTGGADPGWQLTVTAPSGVRLPLGRGARTVPRELQQLVWAQSLGSAMRTVAEIRADRTVRRWVDAAAAATSWREIAVDLADGDEGLLSAVDGVFRQREQHFRAAWKAAGRKPLHRWLR